MQNKGFNIQSTLVIPEVFKGNVQKCG